MATHIALCSKRLHRRQRAGILLTTEECQLSEVQQRNPGVSREQLEKVFHDFLGVGQTIWLNSAWPATTPTAT